MAAYNTYTQSLVFSSSSSQSATIATGFPNINAVLGDLFVSSSGAFTGQATLTFYNHSDMLDQHIVYIATLELAANSLASAATSGTDTISLNSAAGFAPYNKILIVADGTNPNERQRIAVNGISGSTLTLGDNLVNNHNSASVVSCLPEFGGFSLQDVSAGSNIYVNVSFASPQTVNLTLEIFGFAAAGADLSGLASTTAINSNLLFASDNANNIGASGASRPADVYIGSLLDVASGAFHVDSSGDLTAVNNVPYVWPGSQGSASTVLTNDGSGNLSWAAGGGGGGVTYPLLAPISSASAPSYSFSGYTNSGLFFNPSGYPSLDVAIAGTARIQLYEYGINIDGSVEAAYGWFGSNMAMQLNSAQTQLQFSDLNGNIALGINNKQVVVGYAGSAASPSLTFTQSLNSSGMLWDATYYGVGFGYSGTELLVIGAGTGSNQAGIFSIANSNYIDLGARSGSSLALSAQGTNGIVEAFAAGGMECAFGQGQCYMQATGDRNAFILGPTGDGFQGIAINNLDNNPIASTCIDLHAAGATALCLPNTTTGAIATPHNGMLIYDTGANAIMAYVAGSWVAL